ncbi:MAG: hypothetical protein IEMM0008_1225 [bacterium]|nr:MAG: hypothetical protein IEMM0008_1225 [bacterium]
MEHINYLYYNGVLQNLHKHLQKSPEHKESFHRAIQSIENRLKEYESEPVTQKQRGRFLKATFESYLSQTTRSKAQ